MKIGVKIFDEKDFLDNFEDKVDFFEVMAIEKVDYSFLKKYKLPFVIHSQHRNFGVNIADKTNVERNQRSINFAISLANQINAKKIILHPGELVTKDCTKEQSINFINNIKDKRIIIENIGLGGVYRYGAKIEDIKEILKKTKRGFCFDINHAILTATVLKIDYREIIKEFVKLKPTHYHFGGQIINDLSLPYGKRDHLALAESDFDLKEVIALLPKDAEITLETTTDINKTLDDVRIMKEIMKELKI